MISMINDLWFMISMVMISMVYDLYGLWSLYFMISMVYDLDGLWSRWFMISMVYDLYDLRFL